MSKIAFKFAHLTDIHLPIRKKPPLRSLLNKRILGYQSWLRKRSARHQQWASEALIADIRSQSCDTVLITGDLVNIALPSEFQDARRWLDGQFGSEKIIYTPGNHDTYTTAPWDDTLGLLSPYMSGDRNDGLGPRAPNGFEDFPFFTAPIPSLGIIGANSSPTTAPGLATGTIGQNQRQRLSKIISDKSGSEVFNVLMLHHPITPGVVSRRKELTDRTELCNDLTQTNLHLVLHGHAHIQYVGHIKTANGTTPVVGGGSASHPFGNGKYRPARYNLFDVSSSTDGEWSIKMTIRELNPQNRKTSTVETLSL